MITAACYEHAPIIGSHPERMRECEYGILDVCRQRCSNVFAWCILPNHYHVLVQTEKIGELRRRLGQFHGRSSFSWNTEDSRRGRKVWYNCLERPIKSEGHYFASLNYIHHNAVKHKYVNSWQDWPFSSAERFLEEVGRNKAKDIWQAYPILDYGKKWDIF
ncbi:MAG: hypothetical protein GY866_33450 [Proteobacteria bacterium]|nr:hypothetical protein [Pseudomonadota bacterium]